MASGNVYPLMLLVLPYSISFCVSSSDTLTIWHPLHRVEEYTVYHGVVHTETLLGLMIFTFYKSKCIMYGA